MIRWATITAKTDEAVQLEVHKLSSCKGCQLHCDKPLFDIFKLHKNQFWLSESNRKVSFTNPELVFSDVRSVGQKVGLELSEDSLLKTAFLVYILPLMMSFVTMVIGQFIFVQLMWSADAGALLGFLFGFMAFYFLMQFYSQLQQYYSLLK